MGIALTLAELKQYLTTWHGNNFNDLHEQQVKDIADGYLKSDIIENETNINTNTTNIDKLVKILSSILDGDETRDINKLESDTEDTTKKLTNLISRILTLENNTGAATKIYKDAQAYTNTQINNIEARIGTKPKTLQEQFIQSNSSLNDFKQPGIYICSGNVIANSIDETSRPEGVNYSFTLIVLRHQGASISDDPDNNTSGVRQVLLTSGKFNKIFTRNYALLDNNDTNKRWTEWSELYTTSNTEKMQMTVEFSDGSSGLYTLLKVD